MASVEDLPCLNRTPAAILAGIATATALAARQPRWSREQGRAALRRIGERAEQSKLGAFDWAEWKSYRGAGRPRALSTVQRRLPGFYSDETTDSIRRLFDTVGEEGAVVPALWRLKIANSLTLERGRAFRKFYRDTFRSPTLSRR
jgi:hypothetical protein